MGVSAQETPLFVIPTESALAAPVPDDAPLRIVLYTRDLRALASVLGMAAPASDAQYLSYTIADYPQLAAASEHRWLESTFVIDYDEPDTVSFYKELIAATSDRPSRKEIVGFVSRALTGSYRRAWELASAVARHRDGDCTENAVLVTAMARSAGLPARVVLGTVLVSADGGYAAYGHAWAEVFENGRWVVADAALEDFAGAARYIPFGVLDNEGPGFTMALARLGQVWIQRIVVVGRVASEHRAVSQPADVSRKSTLALP